MDRKRVRLKSNTSSPLANEMQRNQTTHDISLKILRYCTTVNESRVSKRYERVGAGYYQSEAATRKLAEI